MPDNGSHPTNCSQLARVRAQCLIASYPSSPRCASNSHPSPLMPTIRIGKDSGVKGCVCVCAAQEEEGEILEVIDTLPNGAVIGRTFKLPGGG